MKSHSTVLIVDYGSQYTQLITRRVRELGVYAVVVAGDSSYEKWLSHDPRAIILSGGPSSVYDDGAPALPPGFLEAQAQTKIPVLGICYGMQLLVHSLGGKVERADAREYGRMRLVSAGASSQLLHATHAGISVWMSHGDEARVLPHGFTLTWESESGSIAAIENAERSLYGLQFHPEVTHSEKGTELLRAFLFDIAHVTADWSMASVRKEQVEKIRTQVGEKAHVICALSGGVDSTVAAVLVHEAIGDRLHCVFVDTGMMRHKEQERVMKLFKDQLHLPVKCVDASDLFLGRLDSIIDPEQKRKIIGASFIEIFDEAAESVAKDIGHLPEFLVQGTLYPDVIESSPAPGASGSGKSSKKHSVTIKSHHNVGGLPEGMRFKLIEPLRDLFKDEVRALGRELTVPADFLNRHPFPGPGLAVRVIGEITRERLSILRLVDEVFIEEIRAAGIYDKIWQAFAVFLPVKSVGVQGDGRTHDHVVALRAVTSSDGMTADWYEFETAFLRRVSARICNEVRGVNRVVYDISSKPPATIEWE